MVRARCGSFAEDRRSKAFRGHFALAPGLVFARLTSFDLAAGGFTWRTAERRGGCCDERASVGVRCNHPDAAMEWVGRGASAPGRHQAACQLQSKVGRRHCPPTQLRRHICARAVSLREMQHLWATETTGVAVECRGEMDGRDARVGIFLFRSLPIAKRLGKQKLRCFCGTLSQFRS
jgi:hypothetical protein